MKVILSSVVLFVSTVAFAQNGPIVWIAPSIHRVGVGDTPGTTTQAQLYSARNGYAPFQIVVSAPAGGLTGVTLSVSDLQGPATIPQSSYTLYREKYVYVDQGSPNWQGSNQPLGPGWYADALIPFTDPATGQPLSGAEYSAEPYGVPTDANQPYWIDLLVPQTAAPGQYSGTYTVNSDQGSFTGQISLTVWNFTLPTTPTLKSSFSFSTAGNLASQQELIRHKLMPGTVAVADEQSLMAAGLNITAAGFFSGASAGNCVMSAAPSVQQFQAAMAGQQPGLTLYDYSADEITNCPNIFSTLQQWAGNMHQAGLNNLVTMAPTPALFSDGTGSGRSAVDFWVMMPFEYNASQGYVTQALAKGDSAWSYNTLVQDAYSPKWEIDFSPIDFRIQPGFISESLGLTGLLYWKIDAFGSDPWNNPNNEGTYSSNNYPGEGMLVYPGAQVGLNQVVPSMRLKWLRDGVEDYEYVEMLKKAGNPSLAMQIANSVGPDWTNWTRDESALDAARVQLGQAINQLSGGTPPPTTSTTTGSQPTPPTTGQSGSSTSGSSSTSTSSTSGGSSTSTGSTGSGSTSTGGIGAGLPTCYPGITVTCVLAPSSQTGGQ